MSYHAVTNGGAAVFRGLNDDKQERPMALLSDTALLAGAARGDTAAFETLFKRHYDLSLIHI